MTEERPDPIHYLVAVWHVKMKEKLVSYHPTLESARETAERNLTHDIFGDTIKILAVYKTSDVVVETLTREREQGGSCLVYGG